MRLRLVATAMLAVWATVAGAEEARLLVTVGEVTESSAVIWVRGRGLPAVSLDYARANGDGKRQASVPLSFAADHTGKLKLVDLEPATRYRYRLSQGAASLEGVFVTAPEPEALASVTFAWSGDLGSPGHCRPLTGGYPIFRAMARVPVDFFLFVGDTIYGDLRCAGPDSAPGGNFVATTLPHYQAKHFYNRADPEVQEYFRQTNVFAIWDDHEVVNNFSGPNEPRMAAGRRAFLDYFPIMPPAEEPGRLYRRFRWGRLLEVFILDTRQYRSANRQLDGPGKTMLGRAQRRWLVDGVTTSPALWKVVVTSVSLAVPTGSKEQRDSWSNANIAGFPDEHGTGFAVERDAILRELRMRRVKNLIFLAADVHHAELIRHHPTSEWSFHEFIAGPLSARRGQPRPLDQALGSRTLFAVGETDNFGLIRIEPATLTVRILDATGRQLGIHTIGPER